MSTSRRSIDLVLGTAQFQPEYGRSTRPHVGRKGMDASILRAAATVGVDALDTAPVYGDAETAIGAINNAIPVHTKIDPALDPAASLTRSLDRLGRSHVEVLYVHSSAEVLLVTSPVLDAAAALVGERVGRLGVSVYEVDEVQAAVSDSRIEVVQAPLNLFDRRFTPELLYQAALTGTAVYARSTLLQGVLSADPRLLRGSTAALRPYVGAFDDLARGLGKPRTELAFGWVRAHPGIAGVIAGADSVAQLDELAAAFHGPLLDDEVLLQLADLPEPPWDLCDPRRWSTGKSR